MQKMVDISNKSMSIYTLRNEYNRSSDIKSHYSAIESIIKTKFEKLKDFESVIENLRQQRNLVWAHSDKAFASNTSVVGNKYPVSIRDIRELNECIKEICRTFNKFDNKIRNSIKTQMRLEMNEILKNLMVDKDEFLKNNNIIPYFGEYQT